MSIDQADVALTFFEAQSPVDEHHYRFHDEDEASVVAGLLATHPTLTERGFRHLVQLLGRSEVSRKAKTVEAVTDRIERFRAVVQQVASEGNSWAGELLEVEHPEEVSPQRINEARLRLEEPFAHTPGIYVSGRGAASISDAALVRTLPIEDQQAALEQLLVRADSPDISAADRASYLLAASNLNFPTQTQRRSDLFENALALVLTPTTSVADAIDEGFDHPLGVLRLNLRRDSRGEAAYLAAALANRKAHKQRVRSAALGLLGDESVSEYWLTRALQRLGETVAPDVGLLSGQNWALKSLAAILWSKVTEPETVGFRLAADPDVRVRRALALHSAQLQTERGAERSIADSTGTLVETNSAKIREEVLKVLRADPCFSVRYAASNETPTEKAE